MLNYGNFLSRDFAEINIPAKFLTWKRDKTMINTCNLGPVLIMDLGRSLLDDFKT